MRGLHVMGPLEARLLALGLKRAGSTNGGEWAGPCPECGGRDRFRAWPNPREGLPRFWCRRCGVKGLLARLLGLEPETSIYARSRASRLRPRRILPRRPPARPEAWERRALEIVEEAERALRSPGARAVRAWLRARGITEDLAKRFRLGFLERLLELPASDFGLEGRRVFLPRGVTIPSFSGRRLRALKVRAGRDSRAKYVHLRGSEEWLYGRDFLSARRYAVMVEAELDTVALAPCAGPEAVVVATGSAAGCRRFLLALRAVRGVLLAFDSDKAGDEAAEWWRRALGERKTVRLRLSGVKDPGDAFRAAGDLEAAREKLRDWILAGIEALEARRSGGSSRAR